MHCVLAEQHVILSDIVVDGWVLDIGGGGEGVIGRLKGHQVVAIDPRPDELRETQNNALKVVADARSLPFVEDSFNAVTAFFSFMYISSSDHGQVFREACRVLKPGGFLLIWDVNIPERANREEKAFVVPLSVEFPDGTQLKTGYGVGWEDRKQSMAGLISLAVAAGFRCERAGQNGEVFELVLLKASGSEER